MPWGGLARSSGAVDNCEAGLRGAFMPLLNPLDYQHLWLASNSENGRDSTLCLSHAEILLASWMRETAMNGDASGKEVPQEPPGP